MEAGIELRLQTILFYPCIQNREDEQLCISPLSYYHNNYSYLTNIRELQIRSSEVFHLLLHSKLIHFSIHPFALMWSNYIVLFLCFIAPFGLYKSWLSTTGAAAHTREGNSMIHEYTQVRARTVQKDSLQDSTLSDAEIRM